MQNTKHSFVILAYKESNYLESCIESCLRNAGSSVLLATTTDNEHIQAMAKKYNLPVIIGKHTDIGGDFDFAKNTASTELVTIAHQDDIYEPNYAEEIVKAYEKNKNASIIFSDYYEMRNGEKILSNTNLKIKRVLLLPAFLKKNLKSRFGRRWILRFGNAICCPAVTFVAESCPKEVFSSNFACNVDWHAWEKLSKLPYDFVFVPQELMGHRISEESTTTDIIKQGIRTKEDFEIFYRFWPKWLASLFAKIYKLSEKSNKL